MKFGNLVTSVLLRETIDYDDPTERYWDRSPVTIEPEKIYSKPIDPVQKEELVWIKCITKQLFGSQLTNEMYLTNKEKFPYTYDQEKAWKYPLSKAEKFVDSHPKEVKQMPMMQGDQYKYEIHYEIEQI